MNLIELLSELTRERSESPGGHERGAAMVLCSFLRKHGVDVETLEFDADRANVLGSLDSGVPGPTLLLCSHLDVVPATQPGWGTDPFQLVQRGDYVFGRGVIDAKGILAAMATALARVRMGDGIARGRVLFAAVAGEEGGELGRGERGGVGSLRLVDEGVRPDAVVIGEPTQLGVALGHRGRLEARIDVSGVGGHASMTEGQGAPTVALGRVLGALESVADDEARKQAEMRMLDRVTLAVTRVVCRAENTATVPDGACVTVDRRIPPRMHHEDAAKELKGALSGMPGVTLNWWGGALGAIQSPEDDFVRTVLGVVNQFGNGTMEFHATCDMWIWSRTGASCVILGPGDLKANRAHNSNEYASIQELVSASEIYELIIRDFLGVL